MTKPTESDPNGRATDPQNALLGTLPLIVLTGALFVTSYLVFASYPSLGPGNFPLWGLLLTLGFVAGIGAVVSGFYATGDAESPQGSSVATPPAAGALLRARADLGRPAPDLSRTADYPGPLTGVEVPAALGAATPQPWDEDSLPPVGVHGPRPVLTTLDDPGEIGRALAEIEEIQRQLVTRPPPSVVTRETATRA